MRNLLLDGNATMKGQIPPYCLADSALCLFLLKMEFDFREDIRVGVWSCPPAQLLGRVWRCDDGAGDEDVFRFRSTFLRPFVVFSWNKITRLLTPSCFVLYGLLTLVRPLPKLSLYQNLRATNLELEYKVREREEYGLRIRDEKDEASVILLQAEAAVPQDYLDWKDRCRKRHHVFCSCCNWCCICMDSLTF
jgi:hypothetical protein